MILDKIYRGRKHFEIYYIRIVGFTTFIYEIIYEDKWHRKKYIYLLSRLNG